MDEEYLENVFARRSAMSFLYIALIWLLDKCLMGFDVFLILSSSVSFAIDFYFKIHEFLNSSHFALLRFHRGILSSSSGPELSKVIEK